MPVDILKNTLKNTLIEFIFSSRSKMRLYFTNFNHTTFLILFTVDLNFNVQHKIYSSLKSKRIFIDTFGFFVSAVS